MPKRFSFAEAQSLIPQVGEVLQEAVALKSSYDEAEGNLQALNQRVTLMGGLTVDRERALDLRRQREEAAAGLRAAIERVQEFGCLIKDLDIGLIDFPTLFRGVEVYLCWKLGEPSIAYWHSVEEGFRGRKTIDQDFLDHNEGDREQ
jgi:hypothetical protein